MFFGKFSAIGTMAKASMLALLVAMGQNSLQAEYIDTMSSWDNSSSIIYFGETDTATYGQVITTNATDTLLQNFSFLINTVTTNQTRLEAFVMEWDSANSRATGPVLYQSGLITNPQSTLFNEIGVSPNVNLQANTEYVLFFSTTNVFDGSLDAAAFASVGDLYTGGSFVFINNSNNFSSLTSQNWTTNWIGSGDLAFRARLAAVPEPSSWILVGSGLAFGVYRKRRLAACRV